MSHGTALKVLFIGGTGNISTACSRLAVSRGIELYHLNRGRRKIDIPGVKVLHGDISNPQEVASAIKDHSWDAVVDWIAFTPEAMERDIALFSGKTRQYVFISSASVYQKPLSHPIVTESTPLANPFWDYSRNKIACEDRLMQEYRDRAFPVTIVRPSLTYDMVIPVAIGGWTDFTIIDRMRKGKPVVVHGDGSSLFAVTHSDDFARGFVGLLGHQQAIGQAFHITTDELLTWDQIYEATAAAAGVKAKIIHIASDTICDICDKLGHGGMRGNLTGDKSATIIFDNTKIKRFVPDFVATIPYAQGIRRTIAWFEAQESRCQVRADANDLVNQIVEAWTNKAF